MTYSLFFPLAVICLGMGFESGSLIPPKTKNLVKHRLNYWGVKGSFRKFLNEGHKKPF